MRIMMLFGGLAIGLPALVVGAILEGGHIGFFVRPVTFLTVFVVSLFLMLTFCGLTMAMRSAKVLFKLDPSTASESKAVAIYLENFGWVALVVGFLGTSVVAVAALEKPGWDMAGLIEGGDLLSKALVYSLYGVLLKLFIGNGLGGAITLEAMNRESNNV